MEEFRFEILLLTHKDLLAGAWISLKITCVSFIVALMVGGAVGTARSRSTFWRMALGPYVEFMRGTPLLIQLFFFTMVCPRSASTWAV